MKSKSIVNSIAQQKCPRCRTERVFVTGAYNLRSFAKMHARCPNCGQSLDPEPGFFTGAMYVSYGLQVIGVFALFLLAQVFVPGLSIAFYIMVISAFSLMLLPITFRLSRSIWLHLFIPFAGEAIQEKASS